MTNALMNSLLPEANPNMPQIQPGDTVRVHQRITEGRNERVQVFQGVVIAQRGGKRRRYLYCATYRSPRRRRGAHFPALQQECRKGGSAAQRQGSQSATLLPARSPGQVGPPKGKALHRQLTRQPGKIGRQI